MRLIVVNLSFVCVMTAPLVDGQRLGHRGGASPRVPVCALSITSGGLEGCDQRLSDHRL
jgi:hypothetical protein